MAAPKNPNTQNPELTLTLSFSAPELSQLEAFAALHGESVAALHGESVAAFAQRAARNAAGITSTKKNAVGKSSDLSGLWLTDGFGEASEEKGPELFAPIDASEETETVGGPIAPAPKRGVVGEQSALAKGHGLVWEIRCALGRERVHGLGWTRGQLAFVLKLSVVGVRKMEHLGTAPIKSLEARKGLLGLAKALETPGVEISSRKKRQSGEQKRWLAR